MKPKIPDALPPPWLGSALKRVATVADTKLKRRAEFFLSAVEHDTLPEPNVELVKGSFYVTFSGVHRAIKLMIPPEGPVKVARVEAREGKAPRFPALNLTRWDPHDRDVVPQIQEAALWLKEPQPWRPE